MQTMAVQLGGEARSADKSEFGFAQVRARNHSQLLDEIYDGFQDHIFHDFDIILAWF